MPYADPEKTKERRLARYNARVASGTCVDCGTQPAGDGARCCARCAEKRRAHEELHGDRRREKRAERERANYQARRAAGRCGECGGEVSEGHAKCEPCSAQHRHSSLKRSTAIKEARRHAAVCQKCGTHPPRSGGARIQKLCETCHATEAVNSPKWSAAKYAARRDEYHRRVAARVCITCEVPLPADCAIRECVACNKRRRERWSRYIAARPEKRADWYTYKLGRKYGLTRDAYDALLRAQDGRCAICFTTEPGGASNRWHVDHEHGTGKVRGLLCNACNVGLGFFRDDPVRLQRAARYVVVKGGATKQRQAPLLNMEVVK